MNDHSQFIQRQLINQLKEADQLFKTSYQKWRPLHEPMLLNIGANEFYENFFAEGAPMGYDQYLKKLKYWDIKMGGIEKRGKEIIRQIKNTVPLTGVPFMSQADIERVMYIKLRTESKILIEIESITKEVPYSDCFITKELWLIFDAKNSDGSFKKNQCILQRSADVNFIKSTWFEGKIRERVIEGQKEIADKWHGFAEKMGLLRSRVIEQPKIQA